MRTRYYVGFSGTRKGMSSSQKTRLKKLLIKLKDKAEICYFRHGDCLGADSDAHDIALNLHYRVIIHPPENDRLRAFCKGAFSVLPPKFYMVRNKEIVKKSKFMLFAPNGEEATRLGTWSTIRFSERNNVPMQIIYPNGRSVASRN